MVSVVVVSVVVVSVVVVGGRGGVGRGRVGGRRSRRGRSGRRRTHRSRRRDRRPGREPAEIRIGRGARAAGARVGVLPGLRGLIERDRDQPAVLVGRRALDLGHDRLQEAVGGGEPGRGVRATWRFAAVVARRGDDVRERRGCACALQILGKPADPDLVVVARGAARHRSEVHERVAPGRGSILGPRRLRHLAADFRNAAGGFRGRGHALHVSLPCIAGGRKLARERLGGGRILAAVADHLPARPLGGGLDRSEHRTIAGGLHGRPLPADQPDLVRERRACDRVVVLDELALVTERAAQIPARGPERLRVATVREDDQERVLDRRKPVQTCRGGVGARRRRRRGARRRGRLIVLHGGGSAAAARRAGAATTTAAARSAALRSDHGVNRRRGRGVESDHDQRRARERLDAGPADKRSDNHAEREHPHHGHRAGGWRGHHESTGPRPAIRLCERVGERGARREIRRGSLLVDRADQPRDLRGQRAAANPALHAVALVVGQWRIALGTSQHAARLGGRGFRSAHRRSASVVALTRPDVNILR